MTQGVPTPVAAAAQRASAAGFPYSCEPAVGHLLAVLAACVPPGGRILELGTGTGVGTAWMVSGLLPRTDVTVTTVESDAATADLAAGGRWPDFVDLRRGDALQALPPATFALIFADAPAGKWYGLDRTLTALRPGGVLVVDDMTPTAAWTAEQHAHQSAVRTALLGDPRLVSVELDHGSGVILSTRRG